MNVVCIHNCICMSNNDFTILSGALDGCVFYKIFCFYDSYF